jgi:hypothetical protein
MAKISTYPFASPVTLSDMVIGTDVNNSNATKNFEVEAILGLANDPTVLTEFIPYTGATGSVNLGTYSINADEVTGNILGALTRIYIENGADISLDGDEGNSGEVLTSQGSGNTPTWEALPNPGILVVDNNLSASNTTMANTDLTLAYGVNVITTATATNYACKLPLPTTGKSLFIINKSTMPVLLFPSMVGGQINNNPIDTPASIPPDGRSYMFICTENPLPGEWTWNPATVAQYDSGVITVADTGVIGNGVISAADSTQYLIGTGFYSNTYWSYNGAFKPGHPSLIVDNVPGFIGIAFQPSTLWNSILKIKVYTNISSTSLSSFQWGLTSAVAVNSYLPGTTTFEGLTPGGIYIAGNFGDYGTVNQTVPGATLGVHELTTNVGDPGTAWGEISYDSTPLTQSGIGTVGTRYLGLDIDGNDSYVTQYINFQLQPRINNLIGLKFRFLIEYS